MMCYAVSVMTNQLSERHLALLREYDTPTICNVIELFAVRPRNTGYMDGRIRACFPEMPPAQRLGIIAGLYAVLGIGVTMLGVRRVRGDGGH